MKIIDYPNILKPESKINKNKLSKISEYCSFLRTKYNVKFTNIN